MRLDDLLIRKIALAMAVFGLAALVLIAELEKPKEVSISEIDGSVLGGKISTAGIVTWRHYTKDTLIFGIEDIGRINAVKFSPTLDELAIVEQGAVVRVSGTVQEYKGKPEIVAEEIKLVEEAKANAPR